MGLQQLTLVTVATCDLCGASETHASSPGSPTAEEHFTDRGWALITGLVAMRWKVLDGAPAALCPKCTPVHGSATVPKLKVV
jgi:hypothetical protein